MNTKKTFLRAFGATLLSAGLVAGCGSGEAEGASGGGPPGGAGGGPPAIPVDVATATRDTAREEVVATGEIEALQAIEVQPEVEGRIVEIRFREGAEVGRGAALFKIDDAELEARVARLEAERDLARQALGRTRTLLEQGAASRAELEAAEARARSTQAELDLEQIRLERTVVRAPFSGVVGERLVSLGDYVTTSTPLVTLQSVDPQRAAFDVPERYARDLALGQEVQFEVAAVPDRAFTGIVDFVDPRVRLPGRTILIKARVPNPDRTLRAGMFIEARLATSVRPDAVWVPEEAVVTLDRGVFVWVLGAEGQVFRRPVEVGIRRPGQAEIRSGVEAGEQVVVAGMERLQEGARVMPRQAIDAGAAASGGGTPPGAGQDPGSSRAAGASPPPGAGQAADTASTGGGA
ncbi:MAG: efflux RND transporter periplasmic adaptor subunit [Gemmatimonadota bacterium]|nr:efflux RND transporter periplasmic adaptor subunit [Gemmatimonadota bacterium]